MQVAVDNTSNLGRKVKIAIPSADVEARLQEKYSHAAKNMTVQGFRKGKIPKAVVQQRYGAKLRDELVQELIDTSLQEVLQKHKLEPVAAPKISELTDAADQDLQYVASFEVFPELPDIKYTGLAISKKIVTVSDADVQESLSKILDQFATYKVADIAAADGHSVIIDFVGILAADGSKFDGGSGEDMQVIIGANRFIEGFESGLLGVTAGQKLDLNLKFPAAYQAEQLAGKDVIFKVTVKRVETKQAVELDADIAQQVGVKDGDITKVPGLIKENLEKQSLNLMAEQQRAAALKALTAANDIDLPESLLQREAEVLQAEMRQNEGIETAIDDAKLQTEAHRRVALSLLLRSIIKVEKILPDHSKVQKRVKEMSAYFENNQHVSDAYKEQLLYEVQNNILVDQVAELIAAKAIATEEKTTLADLMKQAN